MFLFHVEFIKKIYKVVPNAMYHCSGCQLMKHMLFSSLNMLCGKPCCDVVQRKGRTMQNLRCPTVNSGS